MAMPMIRLYVIVTLMLTVSMVLHSTSIDAFHVTRTDANTKRLIHHGSPDVGRLPSLDLISTSVDKMIRTTVHSSSPHLVKSYAPSHHQRSSTMLFMGGKMAKFGLFSPAVYAAKILLGTDKLNKIRGKAISLHSQYIGDFCEWAGAYHLRTRLIKKAKTNGDTLGFLV
jgi:hypothetical protein